MGHANVAFNRRIVIPAFKFFLLRTFSMRGKSEGQQSDDVDEVQIFFVRVNLSQRIAPRAALVHMPGGESPMCFS